MEVGKMQDNDEYNKKFDERMKKVNSWPYVLMQTGMGGTILFGGSFIVRLRNERGDEWFYLICTVISLSVLLTGFFFYRRAKKRREKRIGRNSP